jgi:hypothetical protein
MLWISDAVKKTFEIFFKNQYSIYGYNFIALDRVRADFHSDTESYCNQSDVFSSLNPGGAGSPGDHSPVDSSGIGINLTVFAR